jgi:hypothetical protein
MRKSPLIFLALWSLAGCATGVPGAVTYPNHALNGSGHSSQDMSNFTFTVEDSSVSCRGGYDMRTAFTAEYSFPISCSDGRTGRVVARRDAQPADKYGADWPVRGKIQFSDGSIGMFNLGAGASDINTKSIVYQEFIEENLVAKTH